MTPHIPISRERLQQLLGWARRVYLVVLAVIVVVLIVRSRSQLADVIGQANPVVLILVPVAALGQIVLTSLVWTVGLRGFGSPVPLRTVVATTAASAPARYLPGSVWFAASRVTMLRRSGAGLRQLTAVATLETLLVPVAGFGLGAVLLAATGSGAGRLSDAVTGPLLAAGLVLLTLATPPVVNAVLRWRSKDGVVPPVLTWSRLARLIGAIGLFWVWSGGVFAFYTSAFPDLTDRSLPVVAAAYMVAWGVGWLAPFAPQGLGVFEVALLALLGGGGAGLAVVLGGYRALIAVRDGIAAGVAALWLRRHPVAEVAPVGPSGGRAIR